jgi:hypothetical protein
MLRASTALDKVMSPFSAFILVSYLSGMSTHIGDLNDLYLDESERLLDWAGERFPRSIIFSFVKVRYLRSKGRLREAIDLAQQAVDDSTEMNTLKLFSWWQQSWCSFILLDLEACARYNTSMLAEDTAGAKNSVQSAYSYHLGIVWAIQAYLTDDVPGAGAAEAAAVAGVVGAAAVSAEQAEAAAALAGGQDAAVLRQQRLAQMRCYLEKTPTLIDPKRPVRDMEVPCICFFFKNLSDSFLRMSLSAFQKNKIKICYFFKNHDFNIFSFLVNMIKLC